MATLSKSPSNRKGSKTRRTTAGDTLQAYGPLLTLLGICLKFADNHFDVLQTWCEWVANLLGLR